MNEEKNNNKISEKQLMLFQEKLEDIPDLPPNHELLRWIDATGGNLSLSETLYRKNVIWRETQNIDQLMSWKPPTVIQNYYPGGFAGYDKEGSPVWVIPFGRADVRGMLNGAGKDDFLNFTIKIVETSLALMRLKTKETPSPVTQHVFIFDLDGFSLAAATHSDTLDLLRRLISVYEKNYPETLKAAYVVNASNIFQFVFKIVQATVQQKTLNKIKIFGPNNWPTEIEETIYTFSSKNGKFTNGGIVPQSLYLINDKKTEKAVLEPGKNLTLDFKPKENCQLSWTFKSEGGDVAFRVFSRRSLDSGFQEVDIINKARVQSHKEIQCGHIFCHQDTIYIVEFDNSYSMMRSKKLFYQCDLEIIPQDNRDEEASKESKILRSIRHGLNNISMVTHLCQPTIH